MKGFTPTAESYGFSPVPTFCGRDCDRDYGRACPPSASPSGEAGGSLSLRRGVQRRRSRRVRAGCPATKSRHSQNESAKLSGAARIHEIS